MAKITDPLKLQELQDKRMTLHTSMTALLDGKEGISPEDKAKWEGMEKEYDAVKDQLTAHQAALQQEALAADEQAARVRKLEDMARDGERFTPAQERQIIGGGGGGRDHEPQVIKTGPLAGLNEGDVAGLAFGAWLSGNRDAQSVAACQRLNFNPNQAEFKLNMMPDRAIRNAQKLYDRHRNPDIQNALSSGIGTSGGYTFGETFVRNLEVAMINKSGVIQTAGIMRTTTGEPMPWPTMDDTDNTGAQIGELQPTGNADPTFGQVVWGSYEYSSKAILVSSKLARDNAVGLIDLIPDMLGQRLGRVINAKGTTGNDANTMQGMITASVEGEETASATAVTWNEMMNLQYAVPSSYRKGSRYMFGDTMEKLLRQLVDNNGFPVWAPGQNAAVPDTLMTYPYTINEDMPEPAADEKAALFGRLDLWKLRMVGTIRMYRLTEKYRDTHDADAFLAFTAADGRLLDAGKHPLVHLKMQ